MRNMDVKQMIDCLREQSLLKRDFVVPSTSLTMYQGGLNLELEPLNTNMQELLKSSGIECEVQNIHYHTDVNDLCHEHLSEKLKINKTYYDKMKNGHISLLDDNVNYWFNHERNNYLLRTFIKPDGSGGISRALLSDSYKPIDNWDVCMTVLDVVKSYPNIKLNAADITDRKFYMQFSDPTVELQAPELLKKYRDGNPGIIAGFVISNSEVSEGAFSVAPRAVILACKNGMTRLEEKMRRVHLGSKLDQGHIQWSQQTQRRNLQLIQSQAIDAIKHWMSVEYLCILTNWLNDLKSIELKHPIECTKNICSELSIVDDRCEKVINHFINDGEISPFGIAQAITFQAHEEHNADDQYEIESKVFEFVSKPERFDRIKK